MKYIRASATALFIMVVTAFAIAAIVRAGIDPGIKGIIIAFFILFLAVLAHLAHLVDQADAAVAKLRLIYIVLAGRDGVEQDDEVKTLLRTEVETERFERKYRFLGVNIYPAPRFYLVVLMLLSIGMLTAAIMSLDIIGHVFGWLESVAGG